MNDNQPIEPQNGHDNGGMGDVSLFDDVRPGRHRRRYARDVIQLLRFQRETGETIFTEDEVVGLLRGGGALAVAAVQNGKQREYAACMKILLECVKTDQAERKENNSRPKRQDQHLHFHGEPIEQRIARLRAASDKLRAERQLNADQLSNSADTG